MGPQMAAPSGVTTKWRTGRYSPALALGQPPGRTQCVRFSLRLPIIPIPVRVAPLDEGREGGLFCLEEAADLFGEGVLAL